MEQLIRPEHQQTPRPLRIRRAAVEEVPVAAGILEDAIAWSSMRGFGSWPPGSFADPQGGGRRDLMGALRADGLYLVFAAHEPVATFSLLPEDSIFWAKDPPGEALYLHRFAVNVAGTGVGMIALGWVREETRRRGPAYLRLDCLAENPGIRRYYERAGFIHRGDVDTQAMRISLYEMDTRSTPEP